MADGQDWSFPAPPQPGVDAQFDALADARMEAEDRDEVLRIELAISILLLSRNYNLTPADYRCIFNFDGDCAQLGAVQTAISAMIGSPCHRERSRPTPDEAAPTGQSGRTGRVTAVLSSWAVVVKAVLGS
jgi:hypothetical protein